MPFPLYSRKALKSLEKERARQLTKLLVAIEKALHDQGIHTSWGTVKDMLKTRQLVTMVLPTPDGRVLKIRRATKPKPEHLELYAKLNGPFELIKPKKTWLKQA